MAGAANTPPQPPAESNQQQATALLAQIPFDKIIGGPLTAAVNAQAAAAAACWDFIQKIGFSETKDANNNVTRKVTDVTFSFERTNRQNPAQKDTLSITVPMLTIMPIPFIRIESLTVNFKASISAVTGSDQKTDQSLQADGKVDIGGGFGPFKASLTGGVSSKKDSSATSTSRYSVEHTMDISVHAVQDEMPAGMSILLGFLTSNIEQKPPTPALPAGQPGGGV